MLDELFDVFERDRDRDGRSRSGERRGGVRGFFSRMLGGDDRRAADHDPRRYDRDGNGDDDDDEYRGRQRRRDRDPFEFGDD